MKNDLNLARQKADLSDVYAKDAVLLTAGVDGIMLLPNHILHLIAGLNADHYAAEITGQLALQLYL